jgi:hypothetical protein
MEFMGSVVMQLLDPARFANNRKYLDKKYSKSNRVIGSILFYSLVGYLILSLL